MSKVYGYARYYSTEDAEEGVGSLVWELASAGADEIITEATPISTPKSPKLMKLLQTAQSGSSIICPSLTRLCPSMRILYDIVSTVKSRHLCLFIPQKLLLDFRTGTGDEAAQAFVNACTILSELDHSVTSELVRAGIYKAKKQGRKIGRRPTCVDDLPTQFIKLLPAYRKGTLNITQLARASKLSRPTVYKYLNLIGGKRS